MSLFEKEVKNSVPAMDAAAVTPNDTTDLALPCLALWVGTAGDVVIDTLAGTTVTIGAASGLVPIGAKRVRATSTTASRILALY